MSITPEAKASLIKQFARTEGDTGSPEVQVAILTHRINYLTGHFMNTRKTITRAAAFSRWSRSAADCSTI